MLLRRWEPLSSALGEINRLQREMNQLFERYGVREGLWPDAVQPGINVWEDANHLYAEAELPGMELQDLEIYVTGGNQLTLKGQRKRPAPEKAVWHRSERAFDAFTRVLTLPSDVNADAVTAQLTDGILTVKMPKKEEAKPKRISVQVR